MHCRLWPPFPPLNVEILPAAHLTLHPGKETNLETLGVPITDMFKTAVFWFKSYFKPTVSFPPEHLPPQREPNCWRKQPEQNKPPFSTGILNKS